MPSTLPRLAVHPPDVESFELRLPRRLPRLVDGLVVDRLGDEILVFDAARQLALRLDGAAAAVFDACGEADVDVVEVARDLARRFGCDGRALLLATLEELGRRGLVREAPPLPQPTRRFVLGALARSAVVVPTVLAVAVPSPAAAMSSSQVWLPSATACDPEFSIESYDPIRENDFRDTLVHPVSTLSVDVDTASYSNVRRFLEAGELPPRDAVRSEELINYFSYDYPPPLGPEPFSLFSGVASCPWREGHHLVHLGLKTRELDADVPPRNLVFLVDSSGSMAAADKMPLLQASFRLLVDQLTAADHVSIVAYAGSSGLVLAPTPGDEKETILSALDRLRAGGSTNGGSGLRLAYRAARKNFDPRGVNRVLLATDGDFNVGVSSRGELQRLVEKEGKGGVDLTVLGFGRGNLKDAMVEELTANGDGVYAYIDSLAEARRVLVEQAGSSLVTVARDVKVQVEWNPLRVAAYRLIGYENRLLQREDFLDDGRDAGDVGAGHCVTVLYEVIPETGAETPGVRKAPALRYQQQPALQQRAETGEMAYLRLRYKPVERTLVSSIASREMEWPLEARGAGPIDAAGDDQRLAAAVAGFAMLLRESSHRGSLTWGRAIELAESAIGEDFGGYRGQLVRLMRAAAELAGFEAESGESPWPWRA